MKKALLLFSLFMGSVCLFAQTPDFSLVGFGSATTGGAGGTEVTVTSLAQLTTELSTVGKKIIIIDRTFTASGTILEVTSDKTILGVGDKAFLQGIGFHLKNASNVIIRNIKMTMIDPSAPRGNGTPALTGSVPGSSFNATRSLRAVPARVAGGSVRNVCQSLATLCPSRPFARMR